MVSHFKRMMRKFSIAILFILATTLASKAQQVMYSQTFEDTATLFQNYVLANLDNGHPAGTGWDTLQSVPWFVYLTGPGSNHAAVGTSNYDTAVAADDWFITAAIRIGKASKLSWKSLSLTNGTADTYEVYVSTTEQSVSGCLFNGPVASFTSDNAAAFKSNALDLAAAGYSNQVIFIGFRLNTLSGGDKLAIDDLLVVEDSSQFVSLTFRVDMTHYIADSLFDPRADTVDVAGIFNNFNGSRHILSIVPGTDSTLYSITIPGFLDGDRLEFRFRINSSWSNTSVEFPFGQPNRVWIIEHDKYTYSCFYNDYEGTPFGIPENGLMDQVKVYPNPAQDLVSVEIPEDIRRILLVNLTGSKLLDRETQSGSSVSLDVSTLAKGTYIVLFYTGQGFAGSKKLIKN
jgi:hypothetical protein